MSQHSHPQNLYTVLGVRRGASVEEIRAAYRARAKTLHPDKNPQRDTTLEFQRLVEACAILEDPARRELHDRALVAAESRPRPAAVDARNNAVTRRQRGCMSVVLATAAIVAGFVFFESEPESGSATWSGVQTTASSDIPGLDQTTLAAVNQTARASNVARLSPAGDVEIAGRDGRKHLVSGTAAQELETVRNQLFLLSEDLRERSLALEARRAGVERTRRTLKGGQTSEIRDFNEAVEALNRDTAELVREVESHAKKIDAFFLELDRVTFRKL